MTISYFLSKQASMPDILFFSAYDFASYFNEKMEMIRRWLPKTPTTISTHLPTATTAHSCLPSCIRRWFIHSAPLTCTLYLILSCTLKDIIPVISFFSLLYRQVFILINFHFTLFFFLTHSSTNFVSLRSQTTHRFLYLQPLISCLPKFPWILP